MFSRDLYCRHIKTRLVWERVKGGYTMQTIGYFCYDAVNSGLHGDKTSEGDYYLINPLPDHKILNWSKLKQIADGKKCI